MRHMSRPLIEKNSKFKVFYFSFLNLQICGVEKKPLDGSVYF